MNLTSIPRRVCCVLLGVVLLNASLWGSERGQSACTQVASICVEDPGAAPGSPPAQGVSDSQDAHDDQPSAAIPAHENRQELRIGSSTDVFSFTGPANAEAISLSSQWTPRYSSFLSETLFQRFGESAAQTNAALTFKFTPHMWLTGGGGVANPQDVVARAQANVELGLAHPIGNWVVKGSELYIQQRNYWFTATRVSTFGMTDLVYLPRDWSITLSGTAARTFIAGLGAGWTSSGFAKLGIPIRASLAGNVLYGFGAENFGSADQIGRIAARSFGGGLQIRFRGNQDVILSAVRQYRSQGQRQFSCGLSYGIRF